jgi:hypothetical protein
MQGNEKADQLMIPVSRAIERHVKDRDAKTEIYNRAYEALMISMDVIDTSAKVTAKQIAENAKNLQRAERAESIIRGMFPMWIAAMSYCEHGRAASLDRMRNYYNGRDNPLTGDELHYLFSMKDKKK